MARRRPGAPAASTWACCSARRSLLLARRRSSRPGSVAGTLDFRPGGILGGRIGDALARRSARAVHLRHRQGGADAVPPLAARGDGGADAGQRAAARRGRGQGRRLHRPEGDRLRLRRRHPGRTRRASTGCRRSPASPSSRRRSSRCAQDNLKRRLAYSTVSQLSYVVLAAALLTPLSVVGAALHIAAHAVRQDHAVLRRRRDLHRRAQDRGQPARRHRPAHAVDDGRVRRRRAVDDRPAADRRLRQQVVHPVGRVHDRAVASRSP